MWRRATAVWVAVTACGCGFEALDIRLRDAAVELAPRVKDVAGPDSPPADVRADVALPDATVDAPPPDLAPVGQRSCMPPASGCGQARIAGGTFAMGDPAAYDSPGADNRAVPMQPSITVSAFMLDRYEVTVARFRRFVTEMGRSAGAGFLDRTADRHCNWPAITVTLGDREGHPMNCVEWQTAMDFCAWDTVGGTLPTEAQWEFAARGPMNRPWPWVGPDSAAPDNRVCWNRYSPTPLGTCMEEDAAYAMGTTPDGVWHLVGNVWEWTRDWYAPYTDTTCWNGQARTDPLCTNSANGFRSIRGGSWLFNDALVVRSGARIDGPRTIRGSDVGFRCAGAAR